MHTTLEAIIEPNGQIRILEQIKLFKSVRALITILENEPKPPQAIHFQVPEVETDFSKLINSLAEFPEDFMAEGRMQPAIQEREGWC
jgi:hypothetical protein